MSAEHRFRSLEFFPVVWCGLFWSGLGMLRRLDLLKIRTMVWSHSVVGVSDVMYGCKRTIQGRIHVREVYSMRVKGT
jgi:hypothetical protein